MISADGLRKTFGDVVAVDDVRVRWIGHRLDANMRIVVDDHLSLSEGHAVASRVHDAVMASVPKLDTVLVAIEPAEVDMEIDS